MPTVHARATLRAAARLLPVMAVAAVLGSCSGGSRTRTLPAVATTLPTTTIPPPPTSPTTTAAPTTTATSGPTASTSPASSPEGYAKALYAAWTRGDRAAAATVAQPQAVADLFARPWQAADGWAFVDCSGAAGSVVCTWQRPSGQLLLRVQNVTGGVPVKVTGVKFLP